jgi:hypothetical protein
MRRSASQEPSIMRSFAAVVVVVSGCFAVLACGSAKTSAFEDEVTPNTTTADDQGGGSFETPTSYAGSICIPKTKNVAACERCCEVEEASEGYDVFKQAINACACQPSKCGGACVADVCASPPLLPPAVSACTTCMGYVTRGEPIPADSNFGGGASKDLGVSDCRAYGAEVCKKSQACQKTEYCKAACRDRARDAGTL